MLTQVLIYKKDNDKKSSTRVGGGILFKEIEKVWLQSGKDAANAMTSGVAVLTKLIRSKLRSNNAMNGELLYKKKSLFKVTSEQTSDRFRFSYTYDFPISKVSNKQWKYGFFFANEKLKLGNIDAIRRWLKKKAANGMKVYYTKKTKNGYVQLPPTKNWQWNAATFAVIKGANKTTSSYKPKENWWKLDVRGEDAAELEKTLVSRYRHLIQYHFKKGWNNLPK